MPRARSRRSSRSRSAVLDRDVRQVRGVDPLGQVPEPLAPCRPETATSPRIIRISSSLVTLRLLVQPDDGHATTQVSGMSRDEQRSLRAEQVEHVAAEAVVGAQPLPRPVQRGPVGGAARCSGRSPAGRISALSSNEGPVPLQRPRELVRPVRRPQAGPGDQVGVRRDRGRRVDLQQGQPLAPSPPGRSGAGGRAAGRARRPVERPVDSAGAPPRRRG